MKGFLVTIGSLAAAAAISAASVDVEACGGYFPPYDAQQSRSVVAGHRMIVSIGNEQTTLWDQVVYSGSPESFAWVLPVKGIADVGLSSDALFEHLETATQIEIFSPTVHCDGTTGAFGAGTCSTDYSAAPSAGPSGGSTTGDVEDPVQVVAHEVVGPYETVQLSSADPAALQTWLTDHGYEIPTDIAPIVDAYVAEGFDFLAVKLVPGVGVDAMQPLRVSAPGASLSLPLRMVAAGTGMYTPVSLWIIGEGRYEPANFPWFIIEGSDLVWDWNSSSSNYLALRAAAFEMSDNLAWQIESAHPLSSVGFESELLSLAQSDPVGSGYADAMGNGAVAACQADLDDLFSTLDPASVWVTRTHGELSRDALASDLELAAATEQSGVPSIFQITADSTYGDPCRTAFADCYGDETGGYGPTNETDAGGGGCSCAVEPAPIGWSVAALIAVALARIARRQRRTNP